MADGKRYLRLGAVLNPTGAYISGWRLPASVADGAVNLPHYIELARTVEAAKFDLIFLADSAGVRDAERPREMRRMPVGTFEPTTLLAALAVATKHVGLVATASTSFDQPYNVARKFASLDHLSGGRAGWNVVTSQSDAEARNFNADKQIAHEARYRVAGEFTDVVMGLWDSWGDDAFVRDKETGIFVDIDQFHPLNHKGEYFSVSGPLNLPRSPQGHPVIAQAGSSEAGRDLAARTADLVFTAQLELTEAREFYADMRGRLHRFGRSGEQIKILPGVMVIAGRDDDDAQRKYLELQSLIHPDVAISYLSVVMGGADLSVYDPDGPVPDLPEPNGPKSRFRLLMDLARRETLTLRQLAARVAGARGHAILVGGPKRIADHFEQWFNGGACDGFCVMFASLPGGLDDFVELALPQLRDRGLVRTEYDGPTLRDNLGLARPENRFSSKSPARVDRR